MAETSLTTGSREDLSIDPSRCLPMRCSGSMCRRCVQICPHGAVSLDGGLAISREQCRGCLLCTAECPVGALEQKIDFHDCLTRLARVPEPVLGCIRTKETSNAALPCLGGLSQEHLLALCHSLTGTLTINLSVCGDCHNRTMLSHLAMCCEGLSRAGLLEGGCSIVMAESAQDISYREESVDRRSFLRGFRHSIFQSAAAILSAGNGQVERCAGYAEKRVPARRALLNLIRDKVSQELAGRMARLFDSYVTFDVSCTKCQGCAAVCPTGALEAGADDLPPKFDPLLCTGCALCQEFCLDDALQLNNDKSG